MTAKTASVHSLPTLAPVQNVLKAGAEETVALNLETLRKHGEAQSAFLKSLTGAAPDRLPQLWQEASQAYLAAAQANAKAYLQASMGLFQKAQAELQKAVKVA